MLNLGRIQKEVGEGWAGIKRSSIGQAMTIFTAPEGKVDMIDAVHRLCGAEYEDGDIVMRIRGGKVV